MADRKLYRAEVAKRITRCLLLLVSWTILSLGCRALATETLSTSSASSSPSSPSSGTVPFIFDDNRIFVELQFVRPDGTLRKALAFVDLGTPAPILLEPLFKELQIDQKRPLVFRVGGIEIQVESSAVQTDTGSFMTGPNGKRSIPVEAVLPGSVMKNYQVVFDYAKQSLTIARPEHSQAKGHCGAVPGE